MRLYELGAEFERLHELMESDASEDVAVALAAIQEQLVTKAAGIASLIASMDAEASAYAAEVARLTARRKRVVSHTEKLTEYVRSNMEARGIQKLQGGTFTFSIVSNPESVVVDNIDLVPDEYKRTKTEVSADKRAILDAYNTQGECISGTTITRTTRLQIK